MGRGRIIAGKAVILIEADDQVNKGLAKVKRTMHSFANVTGALGDQLMRGGFIGGIASGFMIRQFTKFDDLLLELQVKMGFLGKMTAQQQSIMASMENRIRSLGKTTSYTSDQVAEAAIRLAQGGLNPKEIEDSLQAILDLARGTRSSIEMSSEMFVRTMKTFGLSSSQATEIVSEFVRATRLGVLELDDLEAALKYSSGTAANLRQNLAPILALFVEMSNKGLAGSIGGTSLNTAMSQLVKKSEDMKALLPGFAPVFDTKGNFDLLKTLEEMYKLTSKMSDFERVGLFQDLFNLRGARSISSTQDIASVMKLADSIKNAGNEARLAAQVMDSRLGGAFRRALGSAEDFNLSLRKAATPALIALAEAVRAAFNELDKLVKLNPQMSTLILLSPGIMLGAGLGFIALSKGLRVAAYAAGYFQAAYAPIGKLISRGTVGQLTNLYSAGVGLRRMTPGLVGGARGIAGGFQAAGGAVTGAFNSHMATRAANYQNVTRPTKFNAATDKAIAKQQAVIANLIPQIAAETNTRYVMEAANRAEMANRARNARIAGLQNRTGARASVASQAAAAASQDVVRTRSALRAAQQYESQVLQQLGNVSAQIRIQEQAYDRLYAVRRQLYDLERQGSLSSGGQRLWNELKIRESMLKNIVNVDHSARQAYFQQEYARALARTAAAQRDLTRAQSVARTAHGTANRLNNRQNMLNRIPLSPQGPLQDIIAQQARIDALVAARNSRMAKVGGMNAMKLAVGARQGGFFKTLMSGVRQIPSALVNVFTAFRRLIPTIMAFGKGLFSVLNGLRRFVFSASGVLTIIEMLVLFGDKLPVIGPAMERFGQAFGNMFKELGKIGSYAAGPLALFQVAFKAFSMERGDIGVKALIDGFKSLASIVGTQLVAAWASFKATLGTVWDLLVNVFSTIMAVAKAIYDSVTTIIKALTGLGSAAGKAMGFEGGALTLDSVVNTISQVITEAGVLVIRMLQGLNWVISQLETVLTKFVTDLGNMLSAKFWFLGSNETKDQMKAYVEKELIKAGYKKPNPTQTANNQLEKIITDLRNNTAKPHHLGSKGVAEKANFDSWTTFMRSLERAALYSSALVEKVVVATQQQMQEQMQSPQMQNTKVAVQASKEQAWMFAQALTGYAQSVVGQQLISPNKVEEKQLEVLEEIRDDQRKLGRDQGVFFTR